MKILIACEYSGIVRDAFRKLGHDAWSCDILPSDGDNTYHYQCDITELLKEKWDMVIAFPPCTHLAVSGARHFKEKIADGRQQEGIDFFMLFSDLDCPRVAIENPIGIMSTRWKKPSQIIQPYMFGDPFQKSTCLWLKGLPKLVPTDIVDKGEFVTFKSGKKMSQWMNKSYGKGHLRSKTFQGIANAMANQWNILD